MAQKKEVEGCPSLKYRCQPDLWNKFIDEACLFRLHKFGEVSSRSKELSCYSCGVLKHDLFLTFFDKVEKINSFWLSVWLCRLSFFINIFRIAWNICMSFTYTIGQGPGAEEFFEAPLLFYKLWLRLQICSGNFTFQFEI